MITYFNKHDLKLTKKLLESSGEKRKSEPSPAAKAPSAKKQKQNGSSNISDYTPVGLNWEKQIVRVDTVDRNPDTNQLTAYILFKNGKMARVGMEKVYKHCPIAMLKFYEEHLSV